jgi:MFS family permease
MLLITGVTQVSLNDISAEWLASRADSASLALSLIPFAGIAFFWFTGVIRDHIGDREDRFFATVFLGSGIAFGNDPEILGVITVMVFVQIVVGTLISSFMGKGDGGEEGAPVEAEAPAV